LQEKRLNDLSGKLSRYYGPVILPRGANPFEVLVGFLLSQRTTDRITGQVEKALFRQVRSPIELAGVEISQLRRLIRPVNFHRTKARNLKALSRMILEEYDGGVPRNREQLLRLPGVGPKTADGTLLYGFGEAYYPVDGHLSRVVRRVGLVEANTKAHEISDWFRAIRPKKLAYGLNRHLLRVGKDFCFARKPNCVQCPIVKLCDYGRRAVR
jgi:endonuclease-3